MSFLDKNGLQVLTTKLVQGDAIKVASHRGHTVKNVIDNITRECENVATPNTMNLENRINEFKVGKGRDIDVSGDVEEGKIEVGLSGRTYQNLINKRYSSFAIYSNGIGFGSNDSDIVEKISNDDLQSIKFSKLNSKLSYFYLLINGFNIPNMLKPNTTYSLIMRVKSNKNLGNRYITICRGDALEVLHQSSSLININKGDNIVVGSVTTKSSFEGIEIGKQGFYISLPTDVSSISNLELEISQAVILEGDYTQTPIEELPEFFEGIKSSFEDGIVDVEVQGKNLFDGQLRTFNTNDTYIDNIGQHHNGDNNIPIKPNTSYTMTFETISGDSNIYIWNGNEKVLTIPGGKDTVSFRTPLECNSLSFYRNVADYTKDRLKYKIQLEENSKSTPYEPYYKKKISFNIEEPLRSLPNGVCDEIRNNNGQWELVRRVGQIVLDGNEKKIWVNNIRDGRTQFILQDTLLTNPSLSIYQNGNAWCDTLPVIPNDNPIRAIWVYEKNNIVIQLPVEIADTIDKLRAWLSQNPTTVYYELQTPIVTPIDPIEFEVKPLATMTINSEIAPISNHKVVLNRAGQIEQGIVQIAELKSRVDALETAYDSYLLETQHKLSILEFEYELESEEI